MASLGTHESFRDLLLRYRARSGLTQRDLGDRVGVHRRSVQEWEGGLTYPAPERLEALVRVLLEMHGLSPGQERAEAEALWAAVQRSAPHVHAPFDGAWFDRLLGQGDAPQPPPPKPPVDSAPRTVTTPPERGAADRRQDWGDAPDMTEFVGRADEVQTLVGWVRDEGCRLVTVLGMGGIGKTSVAARLALHVAPVFERVYWRGLRDALPVSDWLGGAIGFLSDQQVTPPLADSERLTVLLQLLRARRCLLVLDNFEIIFEPGQSDGRLREGLAGYVRVVQAVAEASHQSCLVLTSREAPPELAALGGRVRTLRLGGLGVDEARALLAAKRLEGGSREWAELNVRFGGNGLALKVVGESIRDLFGGDIAAFLAEEAASHLFGGMRRLLAEQIDGSSAADQRVLRVLAVEREPVTLTTLLATLGSRFERGTLLEALEGLRRRSLVERADTPGVAAFTLQSVVLEYVTEQLVDAVADEIARGEPALLLEQPLIKAQAKGYVRHTQEQLIGHSILVRLEEAGGAESRLLSLLARWREQASAPHGYGPGNVVNLLRLLRGHLRGVDMSHLRLRQVYLAQVDAQAASLVDAELAEVALADVFGLPLSVALTVDCAFIIAGTSAGEVWLWRIADRTLLWSVQGHVGGVWNLAASADGRLLATGGADGVVRLWEMHTGQQLAMLQGHIGAVSGVALSADGHLLASGGADGTVRLWATDGGHLSATLHGHTGAVWSVALAAGGDLLASGGEDGTVRLWATQTGEQRATLKGHTRAVSSLALSPDGRLIASGGADRSVRLWATSTSDGQPAATLHGHTGAVWSVALSGDGSLLASASEDATVRLWDTRSGETLRALHGHTGAVRGVALSADSRLVASASFDGTVRTWDADSGRQEVILQGQTGAIWAVALAGNTGLLASSSEDGTVRLWDIEAGHQLATLEGHTGAARAVALSADGGVAASGGFDGLVRLWDTGTGRCVGTLSGHTATVRGVALSANGRLLASASYDGTVRMWDVTTRAPVASLQADPGGVSGVALSEDGRLLAGGSFDGSVWLWDSGSGEVLARLKGNAATVRGVALSADGRLLASGGEDGTVRLWDSASARELAILRGHSGTVRGVGLSMDGHLLASGGEDGTVRLWETATGAVLAVLRGHTATIRGVALSTDSRLLASGGFDGTVRVWELPSGKCLRVLRPERRYEGLDITGLKGITDAQRAALLALGAVERGPSPRRLTARVG